MAKKISISFKETSKDMALYSLLTSLEDKSHEIKELIRRGLEANNACEVKLKDENN